MVHGASDAGDKKIEKVLDELGNIRKYGAVAMLYYFKFLEDNEASQWREHCMGRFLNSQGSVIT